MGKVSFYLGNILWFCVGGFLGLATSNTLGSDVLFIPSVCYQNGRKTPSFSYGDISPLSVKSSMDIDRKKFTLSIELDKHIQYNLNHEI